MSSSAASYDRAPLGLLAGAAQREAGFERAEALKNKNYLKSPLHLRGFFFVLRCWVWNPRLRTCWAGKCATLEQRSQPPDLCIGGKIPIFILPSYKHRYKADIRAAKWERKGKAEDDTIKMRR